MWHLGGQGGAHGALGGWWSTCCLWSNGADGSWMDEGQCMVAGWTRWSTWCLHGQGGAHGTLMETWEHTESPCSAKSHQMVSVRAV